MVERPKPRSEITQVLTAAAAGEPQAAADLLPMVYDELRRIAADQLAQERPGQTLQATALVHEAYLRIVGGSADTWENRRHFFAAAAESMRRILVERARRRKRQRHGGGRRRVELPIEDLPIADPKVDLLALDDALDRLMAEHPRPAELVKLRYFIGLSEQEAAEVLGISRATAARDWAFARAWLFDLLRDSGADGAN